MDAVDALRKVTSAPQFQFEGQQYAQMSFPANELNELVVKDRDSRYYDSLQRPDKIIPLIIQQQEIKKGRELSSYEIRRAKLYADVENLITGVKKEEQDPINHGEDDKIHRLRSEEDKAKEEALAKEEKYESAVEKGEAFVDKATTRIEDFVEAADEGGWLAKVARGLGSALGNPFR